MFPLVSRKDLIRACLSDRHQLMRGYELKHWLKPFETIVADDEEEGNDVEKLAKLIKQISPYYTWSTISTNGPALCTSLRVLCYLTCKG